MNEPSSPSVYNKLPCRISYFIRQPIDLSIRSGRGLPHCERNSVCVRIIKNITRDILHPHFHVVGRLILQYHNFSIHQFPSIRCFAI